MWLTSDRGNSATARALPWAATTSAADGPIPVGEAIGAVIVSGSLAYDLTYYLYYGDGSTSKDDAPAVPLTGTKEEEDDFLTMYRNFGPNEKASIERTGGFYSGGNSLLHKEFWLTLEGKEFWENSKLSKPYTATILVPKTIVGQGKIVEPMLLDGYPAGVVHNENLSAFNTFMKIILIEKIK